MDRPKVEIISIGQELLLGRTINTNAAYIGRELFNIGLPPQWITTIADEKSQIMEAFTTAFSRSDVVISTGGLGPTNDDITKSVITELTGGQLIFNENILEKVKAKFSHRGLNMPKVNENQALVPDNAILLDNEVGTAPGLLFRKNNKIIFVLPGVPKEMKYIMINGVIPLLKKEFNLSASSMLVFRTIGIAESALYEKLVPVMEQYRDVSFMFYPAYSGVDVKVMPELTAGQQELQNSILKNIGKYVFSQDENQTIQEVIQEMCIQRQYWVSAAESCTGGLLQHLITNISGSSAYFAGGVVSYSNEIKHKILGVSVKDLEHYGAVSDVVASQMAEGVRKKFKTNIGIAITGIAGPTGERPGKPVGTVYICVRMNETEKVKRFQFGNDREINKIRSAYTALTMLWRMLKEEDIE
ncbi:MAG: competence/damage-inducible protein A [Calditrichia bacterium]